MDQDYAVLRPEPHPADEQGRFQPPTTLAPVRARFCKLPMARSAGEPEPVVSLTGQDARAQGPQAMWKSPALELDSPAITN